MSKEDNACDLEYAASLVEDSGMFYTPMLVAEVPLKIRVATAHVFQPEKVYVAENAMDLDPLEWRATALCFAAAMERTGDLR